MRIPTPRFGRWLLIGLAVTATQCPAATPVAPPLSRPAIKTELAAQSALMKITRAGDRLVAVGERGIIILSDDDGKHWRQATVPVTVTLNAVSFPSPRQGWAVGHYGVVLHTADGGESWTRQLDGITAAGLYQQSVQAKAALMGPDDPATRRLLADGDRMVADGADKPFFDVRFADDKHGIVIGAYNLAFRTDDGGRSWHCISQEIDNPRGLHLYGIVVDGETGYIAGEQGLFLRSTDGGDSFTRVATPYEGSFFRIARLSSGDIVLAGLRGNAWRSADEGASWARIALEEPVSITATAVPDGHTLLLANQAGHVFTSHDGGRTLAPLPMPPLAPITDLAALADGSLIATSLRGAIRIPPAPPMEIRQ